MDFAHHVVDNKKNKIPQKQGITNNWVGLSRNFSKSWNVTIIFYFGRFGCFLLVVYPSFSVVVKTCLHFPTPVKRCSQENSFRPDLSHFQPLMSFALTNYHTRAANSSSCSGQMDIAPAPSNDGAASSGLPGPGSWSLDVWAEMASLQVWSVRR